MDYREALRRLTVRDDRFVEGLLARNNEYTQAAGLAPGAVALIRIGALVALDSQVACYLSAIETVHREGATPEEVVGALIAVTPVVGTSRAVSAAPRIGQALGYDLENALESFDR
jgi:4-carboxymuconolactone decarboxylase